MPAQAYAPAHMSMFAHAASHAAIPPEPLSQPGVSCRWGWGRDRAAPIGKMDKYHASQSDDGRYRLLVDSITDYAIYMLDPSGLVTSWNPGARRFKGYEPEEILGQHFSRFYTEEDRARDLPARALARAASHGSFQDEGWRVRKDGTRFWASVTIDPIRTAAGVLQGFAKITRDLTERKEAERALTQSQEQFHLLVQGVTDYAIYMLDPDGRVASWNVGAQRIKGYTPEEIIGQHFSRFYTEEDRAAGAPALALKTALAEGRFEKEGQRVRKDGTVFRAHVIIDPVRDDDGKLIGYAKVTRDVTERHRNQLALDQAREALFQSQKIEAVGKLTGGVAHDFNNLLMAILGSLHLLSRRMPDDPQLARFLNNAVEAAKRGATLTQRMLAFARRQSLKPEPVNTTALVHGMSELLQRSLGDGVEIETKLKLALPPVMADANQLELALLNLATNARDAMPGGGKVVIASGMREVKPENADRLKPGRYICLSVSDQGEGMDAETLAHAAEPFFTTKGVGKGTGLGLAMVQGMTEQMGGKLILTSEKGKGTCAQICLPVADRAGPAAEAAVPETVPEARPLNILAVDDDMLVLLNTSAMLEDMGHTVFEAGSGADALKRMRDEVIDLVITDQAMPGMTGHQLAAAIRKEWPGMPIILATGYAELPEGAPANLPILNKPFDETQLRRAIHQVARG
jgi:PAS domain S-box-containing protein